MHVTSHRPSCTAGPGHGVSSEGPAPSRTPLGNPSGHNGSPRTYHRLQPVRNPVLSVHSSRPASPPHMTSSGNMTLPVATRQNSWPLRTAMSKDAQPLQVGTLRATSQLARPCMTTYVIARSREVLALSLLPTHQLSFFTYLWLA